MHDYLHFGMAFALKLSMLKPDFSIKGKRIFILIPVVALSFLTTAFVVGMWSAEDIKETVLNQFNDEQLVIAQHISFLIEREFHFLTAEIQLLENLLFDLPEGSKEFHNAVSRSFARVSKSGVTDIETLDVSRLLGTVYAPDPENRHLSRHDDLIRQLSAYPFSEIEKIYFTTLQIHPAAVHLHMLIPDHRHTGRFIGFHVDVYALLASFLDSVRSGKTGYAWIIDENGYFLYHPMTNFIGQDAFRVRNEQDPGISYGIINFIQKEKMMTGKSGTGHYFSGWHRGYLGLTKKLIAYCAIHLPIPANRNWSVAVVAPISEIEKDVQNACKKQTAMQSLIIIGIIIVGSVTIFFERRLSQLLKKEVDQRTEEVVKSELKYRSLVESAEDFIFTLDLNGKILSLNSFTAHFFHLDSDTAMGKPLTALFPERIAQKQMDMIQRIGKTGKSVKHEFEIKRNTQRNWISASYMPLKDFRGSVTSVLCIARDITESKLLEIQLLNAEKLASLGTLAAGVAHEINNPLSVILGFADILLRKTEKGSQNYEDLKTIERQGFHCKEIVENLLSFVRSGRELSELADMNACIEEIIKIVRHTLELSRIDLQMNLTDGIPQVYCDYRQLQQVLLNIINNAIAAMKENGTLIIKTAYDAATRKGVVRIMDNGHGIRDEDLEHIYEPFFTTKPEEKGTGLGLFVSYGIISKYGGTIDCVSRVADNPDGTSGTTFTIKLSTQGS